MPILKSAPQPGLPEVAPIRVPPDYRGPYVMSTGREVYWTGRVAIGLRYQAPRYNGPSSDEVTIQSALLS